MNYFKTIVTILSLLGIPTIYASKKVNTLLPQNYNSQILLNSTLGNSELNDDLELTNNINDFLCENCKNNGSPTALHAVRMAHQISECSPWSFVVSISFLDSLMRQEEKLKQEGYYTFVHGQRWNCQLYESWYRKLWETASERQLSNFIFAHINKPITSLTEEESLRKEIITEGNREGSCNDPEDQRRQHMLFMNAGLYYNSNYTWSNSAHYVLTNGNVNEHINFTLKNIFDHFELGHLYTKYQTELEQISQEHAALSRHGNLLLVAIPEHQIKDCVTCVKPYGYKKTTFIDGIGETDDIKIIMDTLRTEPQKIKDFDSIEFILAMTADRYGARNPDSGIKFFEFNTVAQDKWTAYKTKENALFERIKSDILVEKQNTFKK